MTLFKFLDKKAEDFHSYDAVALVQNFFEIRMIADVMRGEIFIVDLSNFSMAHMSKITPIQLKKAFLSIEVSTLSWKPHVQ